MSELPEELKFKILSHVPYPIEKTMEEYQECSPYIQKLRLDLLDEQFPQWRINPYEAMIFYARRNDLEPIKMIHELSIGPSPYSNIATEASKRGNKDILVWALSNGPLHFPSLIKKMAKYGHFDLVQTFMFLCHGNLELGDDLDLYGCINEVAEMGARMRHIEMMDWALAKGADIDFVSYGAARSGNLDILNWAIVNGANNWVAIAFSAAKGGQKDIVLGLIEQRKVNINGRDVFSTILGNASSYGHLPLLKSLYPYIEGTPDRTEMLKMIAAGSIGTRGEDPHPRHPTPDILDWVRSLEPNLDISDSAAQLGNLEILNDLSSKIPLNYNDVARTGSIENQLEVVRWAINHGARNYMDIFKFTPDSLLAQDILNHYDIKGEDLIALLQRIGTTAAKRGKTSDMKWAISHLEKIHALNLDYLNKISLKASKAGFLEPIIELTRLGSNNHRSVAYKAGMGNHVYILDWLEKNYPQSIVPSDIGQSIYMANLTPYRTIRWALRRGMFNLIAIMRALIMRQGFAGDNFETFQLFLRGYAPDNPQLDEYKRLAMELDEPYIAQWITLYQNNAIPPEYLQIII